MQRKLLHLEKELFYILNQSILDLKDLQKITSLLETSKESHDGASLNINQKFKYEDIEITLLQLAAIKNHASCIPLLVKHGADLEIQLNTKDEYDSDNDDQIIQLSALLLAARTNNHESVKALIEAKANIESERCRESIPQGLTSLMLAASYDGTNAISNHYRMGDDHDFTSSINHLIKAKANLEKSTTDGYTALMCAAQEGHPSCLSTLITAGAHIEAKNNRGDTPLLIAAGNYEKSKNKLKKIQLLVDAKANLNTTNKQGVAALNRLMEHRNIDAMRLLLENGAKPIPVITNFDVSDSAKWHLEEFVICSCLLFSYNASIQNRDKFKALLDKLEMMDDLNDDIISRINLCRGVWHEQEREFSKAEARYKKAVESSLNEISRLAAKRLAYLKLDSSPTSINSKLKCDSNCSVTTQSIFKDMNHDEAAPHGEDSERLDVEQVHTQRLG